MSMYGCTAHWPRSRSPLNHPPLRRHHQCRRSCGHHYASPIMAAGAPVSSAHHAALAVAYSATATQEHVVERYGKDSDEWVNRKGRWNGRVILTLGDTWTEMEEPIARLRPEWMGEYPTKMTAFQQCLTDFRPEETL